MWPGVDDGRTGWPRLARSTIATAALVVLVTSCGSRGDRASSQAALREQLSERLELTSEESDCVWAYFSSDFSDAELRLIADEGVTALPTRRWGAYGYPLLTCALGPELTEGTDVGG